MSTTSRRENAWPVVGVLCFAGKGHEHWTDDAYVGRLSREAVTRSGSTIEPHWCADADPGASILVSIRYCSDSNSTSIQADAIPTSVPG